MESPHFLGIGAAKAGTTWLDRQLRSHPELWLPPRKELHYFDRSLNYPTASFLASERLAVRVLSWAKHNRVWRRLAVRDLLLSNLRHPNLARTLWNLRFYFGRYDDQWYESLFQPARKLISGEITPGYALLSQVDVAHISSVLPNLKVIYILRNPIERDWSDLRHRARYIETMDLSSMNAEEMQSQLRRFNIGQRSNYAKTIATYRSQFPDGHLFIGFMDDIVIAPREFLSKVCRFLGVHDSAEFLSNRICERVNVSPALQMPKHLRTFLARFHHNQLVKLSAMLGGHATRWLLESETYLANT